jgi:hypothetical protein
VDWWIGGHPLIELVQLVIVPISHSTAWSNRVE